MSQSLDYSPLVFLHHEGTTRLLSEMLPQYLINTAQNDVELKKDGPFYTAFGVCQECRC